MTERRAAMAIRPAVLADLAAVNDIYNHYVRETHVTFDLEPLDMNARREWFDTYGTSGRYRIFVASEGGELLGYATSGPLFAKRAYEPSVQVSIYLSPTATSRGIGTLLYETLLLALGDEDVHRAYAGIAIPNPASIALHERCGFRQVAYFSEQGRKFDKYWDVAWYERAISDSTET